MLSRSSPPRVFAESLLFNAEAQSAKREFRRGKKQGRSSALLSFCSLRLCDKSRLPPRTVKDCRRASLRVRCGEDVGKDGAMLRGGEVRAFAHVGNDAGPARGGIFPHRLGSVAARAVFEVDAASAFQCRSVIPASRERAGWRRDRFEAHAASQQERAGKEQQAAHFRIGCRR